MSLQQRDKLTMKAEGGAEGGCQPGEAAESGGGCDGSAQTARGGAARLKTKRHPGLMKYR